MTSTDEVVFSNASSASNLSSWNALKAATNISNFAPSAKDLVMAGPRMAMKLGSFATEAIDSALGFGMTQRVIPEATGAGGLDVATTAGAAAVGNMVDTGNTITQANNGGGYGSSLTLESVRNFGGIFSYATSKWALMCVFMAVALNRTYVYSSTRRNLTLGWKARLALRITPIILFAVQSISLLQSIQCQTSPDFAELRWGNASRSTELLFIQNGGIFHTISQNVLLGSSDKASCQAVGMIAPDLTENHGQERYAIATGSFQRLWPLFETLCFSQFVETISCAVQGRLVAAETGMTLFEHSLAFAEAEANINSIAGLGATSKSTNPGSLSYSSDSDSADVARKRSRLLEALNTAPEILFIAFISSMNHLTSHVLGVFNMQGKLRLLNTGFWGISFMATIAWSFISFSGDEDGNHSLLRFPTVCIVGFVPHMLVLAGIVLCCVIYFFALILTALASPSTVEGQRLSWYEKFKAAHDNLQADIPMSSIRVSMHMDFYTALLKSGFQALTMASEAVYLNESRGVSIKGTTWLEEDRLAEIDRNGANWLGPSFRSSNAGITENLNTMQLLQNSTSGFARERTAKKLSKSKQPDRLIRDGVGATERTGRWVMAADFFTGIAKLLVGLWAKSVLKSLSLFNIQRRPQWLLKLAGQKKEGTDPDKSEHDRVTLDFWMLNNNGELSLPIDEHIDVEVEMRRRLKDGQRDWDVSQESNLDSNLYNWWLNGGWWGADDSSGDFKPPVDNDEDTTSVLSMSTNMTTESDWESESDNDDGRRTPTQRSPNFTRESTPVNDTPLSIIELSRLLHPQTPEQRAESEALASHMASDTILTRSRFRNLHQQNRARVLTSTRIRPANFRPANPSGRLTPAEEAEILEYLIVTRRAANASNGPSSWAQGAAGMGESGPQCVVCQSTPRSIIVWPCRCLSLCDDCRVTLAMNNYEKCVCCRSDVSSFSRIFVP